MNWKTGLAGVSLGAALLFAGAATAKADGCSERLAQQEWQFRRDVSRHGLFSRQARRSRERLDQLSWQCNSFRGHDRRWDRDRRDHDRRWERDRDDRGRRWERGRGFGFGFGRGSGFSRHRHNRFCRH